MIKIEEVISNTLALFICTPAEMAVRRCFVSSLLVIGAPGVQGHGWANIRSELGETIEARNSRAWKLGEGYPNAWGMSTTSNGNTRPMYCGGLGQTGFTSPEHDSISAPDALQKAKDAGFATRLQKGSKFTLQNFITANHGG